MKKYVWLLAVALMLAGCTVAYAATSGSCGASGASVTWSIDANGVLTITGTGAMKDYSTDGPWTESSVKQVVIGAGVTSIGNYAFKGCVNMTAVTIGSDVTKIGKYAFNGCTSLTSIVLPEGLSSLGTYTFYGCTGLTEVNIPDAITEIGTYTFYNCSSLTGIDIPSGVTSIGSYAFQGCSNLAGVILPEGLTSIGSYAFQSCSNLANVILPEGLTSLGSYAFKGCAALTEMTIPGGVQNAESGLFYQCTGLGTVTFGEGIMAIKASAMSGCSSLTTVHLPETLTSIASSVFNNCTSLSRVTYASTSSDWKKVSITTTSNTYFTKLTPEYLLISRGMIKDTQVEYKYGKNGVVTFVGTGTIVYPYSYVMDVAPWANATSAVIGEGITGLGANIFYHNTYLNNVTFLGSVTSIGTNAFRNCAYLRNITLPEGLTTIAANAFQGATIQQLTLPDSMTTIGSNAFSSATIQQLNLPSTLTAISENAFSGATLPSLTLPESLTAIGDYAFANAHISEIILPDTLTSVGQYAFKGSDVAELTFPASLTVLGPYALAESSVASVHLPDTLTELGEFCFEKDTALTELILPDSLRTIQQNIIKGCTSLTSLTVPGQVTSIAWSAFASSGLVSAVLEEGIQELPVGMFSSAESLESVTIPSTVTAIGGSAFYGCYNLLSLTIPGNVTSIPDGMCISCYRLTTVNLPYSVTSVGSRAFEFCFALSDISIPNVTSIGANAFNNCQALTWISLNEQITEIPNEAFKQCYGLTHVDIPASCTRIGTNAFYQCTHLQSVSIPETIASIDDNAFDECSALTDVYYGGCVQTWPNVNVSAAGNQPFTDAALHYAYETGSCGDDLTWTLTTDMRYLTISGTGNMPDYSMENPAPWGTNVTRIFVEEGVTGIGAYALYGSEIWEASLPSTLTAIGQSAFRNSQLQTIVLPEGVTAVAAGTFAGCTSLTNVSFPTSLTMIGDNAFNGCTNLATAYYAGSVSKWQTHVSVSDTGNSALAAAAFTYGMSGAYGDSVFWELSDEGVLSITGTGAIPGGFSAPWRNKNYTRATIGEGITGIGQAAFFAGKLLEEISLPTTLTQIGSDAFNGCSNLTGITFPDGLVSIGGAAFRGCSSLSDIYIPDSVTEFGGSVFINCTGLTSVRLPDTITVLQQGIFQGCTQLASVSLPAYLTQIGFNTFNGCTALTAIDLPPTLQVISDCAFLNCTGLTEIALPAALTRIGSRAFENSLANQTEVVIPDGVTYIGTKAFYGLGQLVRAKIPDGVTTVGEQAFAACSSNLVIYCGAKTAAYDYAKNARIAYKCDHGPCGSSMTGSNLTWTLSDDGVLTISGTGAMANYESYDYEADWGKDITAVIINEGVTTIGYDAFYGCTKMTSVLLPGTLTSIGVMAFYNSGISGTLTLPASLTDIGMFAFHNCSQLQGVVFTESSHSVTVGDHAFEYCSNLKRVVLSSNMAIRSGAFSSNGIETVVIPDNSTITFGTGAFESNHIASFTVPAGCTAIPEDFLYGNPLTSLTLPEGLQSIGGYAFLDCELTRVKIPASVTDIGSNAFDSGTGLAIFGVTGSAAQTFASSNSNTFVACKGMCGTRINWTLDVDGTLTVSGTGAVTSSPWSKAYVKKAVIENGITSLPASAFSSCTALTEITLPDGLASIPNSAFSGCSSLRSIELPAEVTSIGDYAFSGCSALTGITLPDGVTSIGDSAFSKCTRLTGITLPAGLTTFGNYVFSQCTSLTEFAWPASATVIPQSTFSACTALRTVTLPENLTGIGNSAFAECSALTGIRIPDAVSSIGSYAFYQCTQLSDVQLGSGIRSIGSFAFKDCSSLKTIALPEGIRSINVETFSECALNKLVLPASLNTIVFVDDDYTFTGNISDLNSASPCTTLPGTVYCYAGTVGYAYAQWANSVWGRPYQLMGGTCGEDLRWTVDYSDMTVTISGTGAMNDYTSSTIPWGKNVTGVVVESGVTSIGAYAFYQCTKLTNVTLSDTVTGIGNYAFFGDSQLNRLDLADCETIGGYAFGNCTGLTEVELPEALDAIGNYAFYGCTGVSELYVPAGVTGLGTEFIQKAAVIVSAYDAPVRTWAVDNGYTWRHDQHTEGVLEAVEPTCESVGWTAGVGCVICGEVIEAQEEIPALGHEWGEAAYTWADDYATVTAVCSCLRDETHTLTETVAATGEVIQEATCEAPGAHIYTSEAFENEAFAIQTATANDIAPAGHDWDVPEYTWSDDNSTVTATHVCLRDHTHIESETVPATASITKAAACTENGETTYTGAAYENEAFAVQTKVEADIPALGHEWNAPTYAWAEDNATLTATRTCAHDESHVETETVAVTAEVTLEPDCETAGEHTYTSAAFENGAFAAQAKTAADIPATGHTPYVSLEALAPTCLEEGRTEEISCEVCGAAIQEAEPIPALGHTPYVSLEALAPTCLEEGRTEEISCEVCGEVLTASDPVMALGHLWGETVYTWADDHAAVTAARVCGHDSSHVQTETVPVTGTVTLEATCTEAGETTYTSDAFNNEAFAVQSMTLADIPAAGHTPAITPAVAPTDREPGLTEGQHCAVCGVILAEQQVVPALWTYSDDGLTVTGYNGTATEVTIPAGVTTLSNTLFKNNTSIAVVHVPDEVTKVGTQTFYGATGLTEVWLPDQLDGTGAQTFRDTTAILYATTGSQTAKALSVRGLSFTDGAWTLQYKVASATAQPTQAYLIKWRGDDTELVLPDTISGAPLAEIRSKAFENHTELTRISIPSSVTTIASDAFDGCSGDLVIASAHDAYARTWAANNAFTWAHNEHTLVPLPGQPATCTEPGQTDGVWCEQCGEILEQPTDIPALGHEWGAPEYNWSDDNLTVTAVRVCAHDETHVESEIVNVNAEVTRAATCESVGETTYTTTVFENAAFEVQTKTEANIPALGHAWGDPEYTWSDDKLTVTAARVCAHDTAHVETETVRTTLTVTLSPTQNAEGGYRLDSGSFSNVAFEVQAEDGTIPALGTMNILRLPAFMTEIEAEAFANTACEAVIIPETCTAIGAKAFANCRSLRYVLVSSAATAIAADAFEGCGFVIVDRP